MTRAKDISKILTDADISGTLDVSGAFTSQGIDDNANAIAITIDSSERVGIGTSPSTKLEINGGTDNNIVRIVSTDANANIEFADNTTTSGLSIGANGNNMKFGINGTEVMRIDSNGNLGLGTSSPATETSAWSGSANGLVIENDANAILVLKDSTDTTFRSFIIQDSGHLKLFNENSSGFINFGTNNTERMRIDSSGNLGLGTSSPDYNLQIEDTSSNISLALTSSTSGFSRVIFGDSGSATIGAVTYRNSDNSMAFEANGSERMRIDGSGKVLVGMSVSSGSSDGIQLIQDGRIFSTVDGQACTILNRKTSDGEIINLRQDGSTIGGIYSSPSVTGPFIGHINVGLVMYHAGNSVLPSGVGGLRDNAIDLGNSSNRFDDIFATNSTIQTSDRNEKNTITDSDLGIDFIKRLTPKSYIFNGKTRTHYGLIAQDVETVLSDISKPTSGFAGFIKDDISEEQDGSEYRYGLRYAEFVAPLIQAIKDQQATIDALTARITTLEGA